MPRPSAIARRPGARAPRGGPPPGLHSGRAPDFGTRRAARQRAGVDRSPGALQQPGGGGGGFPCDAKTKRNRRGVSTAAEETAQRPRAFVLKQTHPTRFVNMMLLITDASNEKPILPSLMEIILLKQQLFAGFRVSSFVVFK